MVIKFGFGSILAWILSSFQLFFTHVYNLSLLQEGTVSLLDPRLIYESWNRGTLLPSSRSPCLAFLLELSSLDSILQWPLFSILFLLNRFFPPSIQSFPHKRSDSLSSLQRPSVSLEICFKPCSHIRCYPNIQLPYIPLSKLLLPLPLSCRIYSSICFSTTRLLGDCGGNFFRW